MDDKVIEPTPDEAIEPTTNAPESEFDSEPGEESKFYRLDDLDLRRELDRLSPTDFSGHVRSAFIVLERRIRQTAGLAEHDFGTELIDKAFAPETGLLQPVSPVKAECAGLHNLLKGTFLYYRNPVAHRPINYDPQSASRVLTLIDHALQLVNEAANAAFNIEDFVGPQEGRILHRHDFRLDIDGDGEKEIVAVVGFGPVTGPEGIRRHVAAVILKKTDNVYKKIPAESIPVPAVYEVGFVELRNVTNWEKPDLISHMIQAQPEQLADLGYPGFLTMTGEVYDICRVMKWNETKGLIEQIDEKIAVGLWRPETG